MGNFQQWLDTHAEKFEQEAQEYAEEYCVSIEEARREVKDAYIQGHHEDQEALRSGDWDFGRE